MSLIIPLRRMRHGSAFRQRRCNYPELFFNWHLDWPGVKMNLTNRAYRLIVF